MKKQSVNEHILCFIMDHFGQHEDIDFVKDTFKLFNFSKERQDIQMCLETIDPQCFTCHNHSCHSGECIPDLDTDTVKHVIRKYFKCQT